MTRTVIFQREGDEWYIVLPEWTGHKSDLQMVQGADTMLDIIAEGKDEVELTLSDAEVQRDTLLLVEEHSGQLSGATYHLPEYKGKTFNMNMRLCNVTKFVFGGYFPDVIWLS